MSAFFFLFTVLAVASAAGPRLRGKRVLLAPAGSASIKEDIELVYEDPAAPLPAVGIMLIGHGCNHRAIDSWPAGTLCPECKGLPIETNIVAASLDRGWVVVAVSAVNKRSHCWSQTDFLRVKTALSYVAEQTNISRSHTGKIAVAVIGASSGGHLASSLHLILESDGEEEAAAGAPMVACGAVSQVMARLPFNLQKDNIPPGFPPIRFLHMERDGRTASAAVAIVAALKAKMVDAGELNAPPTAVDVDAFRFRLKIRGGNSSSSRAGGNVGSCRVGTPALPSDEMALAVVQALRSGGILDHDGFLLNDPRQSDWREVLRPVVPSSVDSLVADASALSEVMNTAWAMHEFTDAHLEPLLDWLNSCRLRSREEL